MHHLKYIHDQHASKMNGTHYTNVKQVKPNSTKLNNNSSTTKNIMKPDRHQCISLRKHAHAICRDFLVVKIKNFNE